MKRVEVRPPRTWDDSDTGDLSDGGDGSANSAAEPVGDPVENI